MEFKEENDVMLTTVNSNRRFIKDFQLPIPIYEPEYFDYYIDLFDEYFDTKRKYQVYLDLLAKLGGSEQFFECSKAIQEQSISLIKNSLAYQDFIQDTQEMFSGYKWRASKVPTKQVYKERNDKCYFLSIDLVKANYQALKYYTRKIKHIPKSKSDIVLGTDTFQEFISKFTEESYFKEAKKFRQIIFGNINPKRQQKIQKYLINHILAFLLDGNYFQESDLKDYSSDEIVFEVDKSFDIHYVKNILFKNFPDIELHIDKYQLILLKQNDVQPIFIRKFPNKIDFKSVESSIMPQCIKHIKNMPLNDYDLMFYHSNGMLAKYITPVKWE